MIVGREQIIFFENMAKTQIRIFPDACDYGVDVRENKALKEEARKNLMWLMKTFEYKIEYSRNDSVTSMFIPYEMEEGMAMEGKVYSGIKLTVSYTTSVNKKKYEFITIDIVRAVSEESGFKKK
jgi:hypothetical protein